MKSQLPCCLFARNAVGSTGQIHLIYHLLLKICLFFWVTFDLCHLDDFKQVKDDLSEGVLSVKLLQIVTTKMMLQIQAANSCKARSYVDYY